MTGATTKKQNGGAVDVAVPSDGWTEERRATFLDWLAATANVRRSAMAAGKTPRSAYHLRSSDAGFASSWEDARAAGYSRLEDELLARALGSDGSAPAPGRPEAGEQGAAVDTVGCGGAEAAGFDPELALKLLTRRYRDGGQRRAGAPITKRATVAELAVALEKQLTAAARRRTPRKPKA